MTRKQTTSDDLLAKMQIAARLVRHLNAAGFEVSSVDVMRSSIYAHLTGPGGDHDSRPGALHVADVARLGVSNIKDFDTCTTVDTTFGGVDVTLFGARTAPEARQAQAEAWDEGVDAVAEYMRRGDPSQLPPANPYRAIEDPRTLRSIAGYSCPCGARGWLQEGASDEDRAAFDAEAATHDDCGVTE
ncbi:hypothetical protein [Actinotalea sp.]|uniref:hypothetical protein n=1 Tax=Actinotalea sp. TaxID=1872145 RepID=UPI00356710A5